MKRMIQMGLLTVLTAAIFSSCGNAAAVSTNPAVTEEPMQATQTVWTENGSYTVDSKISEVVSDPVFGNYGRLIFPVDEWYYSGETLGQLQLTWYSSIDSDKTVEIVNYLKDHATAGDTIFYDIYTEAEKAADPAKKIQVYSSLRENRVRSSQSATQAEALLMWEPCTTASPTRWSYPRKATTPLR